MSLTVDEFINSEPVILTSDIWDTVIRRKCHPEVIKFLVAKHIYLSFFDNLVLEKRSVEKIYFERLNQERLLAAKSSDIGLDDEYSIEDVIQQLLLKILTIREEDLPTIVDSIIKKEIFFETSLTYPDPLASELISGINFQKSYYISDFYMPSKLLDEILQFHKLKDLFDGGFTSCESRLNKRSSRLFSHFVEGKKISPNEIVHLGDNIHSDVVMPEKMGIKAYHFNNEPEELIRLKNAKIFQDKNEIFDVLNKFGKGVDNNLVEIGCQLSPLFVGFSEHLLQTCIIKKINKILFITREGKFLHNVFDQYIKGMISTGLYENHDISYDMLSVSRNSLLNALPLKLENYKEIWIQYGLRGVGRFLINRGLKEHEVEFYINKYNFDFDEVITNPLEDARVIQLFSDIELQKKCLSISKERQSLFKSYAADYLNEANEKVMLVDVGWFGSCQNLLQMHYPEISFSGQYIGLRTYDNEGVDPKNKSGFIFDNVLKSGNLELERFAEVIEVLTSADEGSVAGYQENNDKVEVVRDKNYLSDEFDKGIYSIQKGVVLAAKKYGEKLHKSMVGIEDLKIRGVESFSQICKKPSRDFATLYFDTLRHDVFREENYSSRNEIPRLSQLFKAIFSSVERERVIFFFRSVQWREGIKYSLESRTRIERILYRLLFKFASLIKERKGK